MTALADLGSILRTSPVGRQVAGAALAALAVGSLVFLFLFMTLYRDRLIEEHTRASAELNELLEASLRNAMLKRDLDGLAEIVADLGRQDAVADVMILNPEGVVRFASDPRRIGAGFQSLEAGAGPAGLEEPSARFIDVSDGQVLRTVNPVRNEDACRECHGDSDLRPINGVLVVDYRATAINQDLRSGTLLLTASGAVLLCAALAAITGMIYLRVLRPVRQIADVAEAFASGSLDRRVAIAGDNELAQLGRSINVMADRIAGLIASLTAGSDFLQQVIDAVPDGVRVIDDRYRIVKANAAYGRQIGLAPADCIGAACHRSSHGLDVPCSPTLVTCPLVELSVPGSPALKCRHRHLRADGQEFFVEVTAARAALTIDGERRTCVIESIRDLDEQARHSHEQRLSEIGQMAAGMAHEIHNPLSSIHLAMRAIREEIAAGADPATVDAYLETADREIDRCIAVTRRLLTISEPAGTDAEGLVEVNRVVADVLALLRYQAAQSKVTVQLAAQDPARVLGAESDVAIVVLNLVQNAIHAMPEGRPSGGVSLARDRRKDRRNRGVTAMSRRGHSVAII